MPRVKGQKDSRPRVLSDEARAKLAGSAVVKPQTLAIYADWLDGMKRKHIELKYGVSRSTVSGAIYREKRNARGMPRDSRKQVAGKQQLLRTVSLPIVKWRGDC